MVPHGVSAIVVLTVPYLMRTVDGVDRQPSDILHDVTYSTRALPCTLPINVMKYLSDFN